MSHLIFPVCLDMHFLLLPLLLLDSLLKRVPEALQDAVTLLLLLVWSFFLRTLAVMNVMVLVAVLLLAAVVVVPVPGSK